VVRQACVDARRWRQVLPDIRISVNVSPQQFVDPDLATRIGRIIAEEGMVAGGLEIEVTENLVMRDPVAAGVMLDRLHRLGVRIAVDDFGVGYSSLSYLKHFPLDALKIDRTFVGDLIEDPGDAAIVEASISLGHKLGLEVVAEGVETADQRDVLRRLGCDLAQGYYFSRPLPPTEIDALLGCDST